MESLHRLLEWREEGVPWASSRHPTKDLLNVILRRANEASAPYQMVGHLAEVAILRE